MAVTFSYVVLPHLKKGDGTNFIRIRITHQRKSKYIKTTISVVPEDLKRSGALKHQGKIDLANEEIRKMRKITDEIATFTLADMNVDEVVGYIKAKLSQGRKFRLDLVEYRMEQAAKMKPSTGSFYRTCLICLRDYFVHNPDISELTLAEVRKFEEHVKERAPRSVMQYMAHVKAIYVKAYKEFNEPDQGIMRIPVNVFDYYDMPKKPVYKHRDIPKEWLQMMIDQRTSLRKAQRVAIDTFLISFCLMGLNAEDMHNAPEKPKNGIIHYFRTKTRDCRDDLAEMYVRMEPCLKDIIKDYLGKDKLFNYHERFSTTGTMTRSINRGLHQWFEANKLPYDKGVHTFYSARHTWATLGGSKEADLDSNMVTEGLCHSGGNKMDKIYVRKDWEKVWDANAKVLSLLRWKSEKK
jgi:integrase